MRLLESNSAPNARRVRIFLAEKGINNIEKVELDLKGGDNISDAFLQKNPMAKVPVLELDNGRCISESMAICRYFEELQPDPPLMGTSPEDKAEIEMWQRYCEFYFLLPVGMCFQHTTGFFSDRMTPVPDWGVESGKSAARFLEVLERRLEESEYIAGDRFSVADITALCTLDFSRVIKLRPGDEHSNIKRWHALVSGRSSATA